MQVNITARKLMGGSKRQELGCRCGLVEDSWQVPSDDLLDARIPGHLDDGPRSPGEFWYWMPVKRSIEEQETLERRIATCDCEAPFLHLEHLNIEVATQPWP